MEPCTPSSWPRAAISGWTEKLHRAVIFTGVEQCYHDGSVEVVNKVVAGLSGVDSVEGNGASRPGLAIAYRVDTSPGEPEFSPLGTLPSRKRDQTNRGAKIFRVSEPTHRHTPATNKHQQKPNGSRQGRNSFPNNQACGTRNGDIAGILHPMPFPHVAGCCCLLRRSRTLVGSFRRARVCAARITPLLLATPKEAVTP